VELSAKVIVRGGHGDGSVFGGCHRGIDKYRGGEWIVQR